MKKNYKRILAVLVMAAITLFGSLTVISAEEVADAPTAEVENTEEGEHTDTVAVLAAQLKESVPEILTAASLVVSLVLAFIYKKGLLPTLSAALTRLSGGIGEISKRAEESNEGARQMSEALAQRLKQAEQTVDAISESLSAVTAMLEERRNDKNTAEIVVTLFDAQLNLMLDLINSSTLPLTRKEELRGKFGYFLEVIGRMKDEQTAPEAAD